MIRNKTMLLKRTTAIFRSMGSTSPAGRWTRRARDERIPEALADRGSDAAETNSSTFLESKCASMQVRKWTDNAGPRSMINHDNFVM